MTAAEDAPPDPTQAWLATFLQEEARPERMAAWVERTTWAILTALPELTADDGLVAMLGSAVREHWSSFIDATLRVRGLLGVDRDGTGPLRAVPARRAGRGAARPAPRLDAG